MDITQAHHQQKVYENRLRRMAQRQGLTLVKSRRRDPHALDYGGYMLVDMRTNTAVLGAGAERQHWYSASLAEVENYLTGEGR